MTTTITTHSRTYRIETGEARRSPNGMVYYEYHLKGTRGAHYISIRRSADTNLPGTLFFVSATTGKPAFDGDSFTDLHGNLRDATWADVKALRTAYELLDTVTV